VSRLNRNSVTCLCLTILYLTLALFYFPPAPVWFTDIGQRYIQAANIRFTPGLDLAIDYPGRTLDPDLEFTPFNSFFHFVEEGRVLFAKSASVPFLGGLLMNVFGPRAGLLPPLAAGLACAWLAGRLTRHLAPGWEWATTLLAGLGTPVMVYSFGFWEHTLAAALAVGAMAIVIESPTRRGFVWAGALAGLAAAVRIQLALFVIALGVAIVIEFVSENRRDARPARLWNNVIGFTLSASFVGLFTVLINFSQTGRLIPPEIQVAAQFEFTPVAFLRVNGFGGLAQFLFDPPYGWLALVAIAYTTANLIPAWRVREAIRIGALLTIELGVWSFFSATIREPVLHGILLVCPCLVVSAAADFSSRPARLLSWTTLIFLALAVLSLSLLSRRGPAQGEQEWGPRYLIAAFALAAPLVVNALRGMWLRARESWLAPPGAGLARLHLLFAVQIILLSIFIQGLGVTLIRTISLANAQRTSALLAVPETRLVTTEPWLAPIAPEVYLTKEIYLVETEEDWQRWIAAARSHGATSFALVTAAETPPFHSADVTVLENAILPGDFLRVTRYAISP
jgi:hypothetical protein